MAKSLACAALAIVAHAQSEAETREGSIFVTSEAQSVVMYDTTSFADTVSTKVKWTINSYGIVNLDTQERYVAIEHVLETPIFKDDVITFEI